MTRTTLALAGCLVLALTAADDEKDYRVRSELAQLRGRWKVASVATPLDAFRDLAKKGGEVEITTSVDDDALAIDGDRLVWSTPRKGVWGGEWVMTVDPTADPKVIRLSRPPPEPGQPAWALERCEAIYEVTGTTLKLGFNLGVSLDQGLPDTFEVRTGRMVTAVLVFERVREKERRSGPAASEVAQPHPTPKENGNGPR